MKIIKLFAIIIITVSIVFSQTDPQLNITIGTDSISTDPAITPYTPRPKVTLENSVLKAVLKLNDGGYEGIETAFRDIVIKSKNKDAVTKYVDACAQRPAADNATITYNGTDKKTVRVEFNSATRSGVIDYTIYPNSPVIRIDYLEYEYGGWANIVDVFDLGSHNQRIYGQEDFIRELQYYPDSYWNTHDEPYKSTDPVDGGSLNYNGYGIMLYGDSSPTGYGIGRILPFFSLNVNGGMRIIKLLDWGYETFVATGNNSSNRKPFTGFLYVWDSGQDDAITLGQNIIDDYLDSAMPVELVSFAAVSDADSVTLNWATATEVNNYGFNVQRINKTLNETAWSVIGFVDGHGNSNTPNYYSYTDYYLQPGSYSYRLQQIDTNGGIATSDTVNVEVNEVVSVVHSADIIPEFNLSQNYPNPFNPETNIVFELPEQGNVKIKVYNSLGSLIEILTDRVFSSGNHNIKFNGTNLSSGIYFYSVEYSSSVSGKNVRVVRKMSLLK